MYKFHLNFKKKKNNIKNMSSSDKLMLPQNKIISNHIKNKHDRMTTINDFKTLNTQIMQNYEKQMDDLKDTIKAQKSILSFQNKRQQKTQQLKKENNTLAILNKYYLETLTQQLIENQQLQLKVEALTHQINLKKDIIKWIDGKNKKLKKKYKLLQDKFELISEENENLQFWKDQFKPIQKKHKKLHLWIDEKINGKKRKLSQIL